MKKVVSFLMALFISSLSLISYADVSDLKQLSMASDPNMVHWKKSLLLELNYKSYKKDVDKQIFELGYSKLRDFLSKEIHAMAPPWDMDFYRSCMKRKEVADYQEDCDNNLNESEEERYVRLEVIVDAIILEINNGQDKFGRYWFWSKEDLAFAMLIKTYNESGMFSLSVHTGKGLGDKGKSFGLGQIWSRKGDKYYRKELVGYNSNDLNWSLRQTRHTMYMAAQHLTYHNFRCNLLEKNPSKHIRKSYPDISPYLVSRMYNGYASGKYCSTFKDRNGKPYYESLRRAGKFWELHNKYFNQS